MKSKLVKVLSVVSIVCVLVCCFAFSSSAEDSSVPSNAVRFMTGKDNPNLNLASGILGTYVPIFEFYANGIMFETIQITSSGVYYSGSGIRVQAFSTSTGWLSDYRCIYVKDFGANYNQLNSALFRVFDFVSSPASLYSSGYASVNSSFDISIDDISIAAFVMPLVNTFGLGSSGFVEYPFNVSGFYNNGSSSATFDEISFIFDEGDIKFKLGNRYLLYNDAEDEQFFKSLMIHFDSCPLFLRNYFASHSAYFLGAFPYYVHNSVDLSYMDISLLTDSKTFTKGRFYLDYSVAFDNSYNGYPLNLNSYFCLGGGDSSAVYPGAHHANLLTPSGLNLASSIIIPYGSISDNIVSDSVYFIFTTQTTPYYDSQGFTVSKTLEFSLRDSTFASSPFNTFDLLGNILVLCNSVVGDTFYTYVRRSGNSFLFYPSSDTSVYDVISFEDLKGVRVAILAGSSVNPVWYNFCALNGDLLVYGSGSGDYDSGYNAGYLAGQEYGKQLGINEGQREGYDKGYQAAKLLYGDDNGGIIGKLLSAPGDAFDSLILYENENLTISIWDVFTTLICASLFIWFLKLFAGG